MVEQTKNSELTDAEAELYDRQIRLWGLESQKRLRAASVLIVGLNGYTAEVAKNIILAGVKSVTFLDHRPVTSQDFCAQFFLPRDQIGKNRAEASVSRAQNLNPMVEVKADPRNVDDLSDEFFNNFDVVCITECTVQQINKINAICRKLNKKFFTGDVWGTFGYTFADLMTHDFVEDVIQTKRKLTLEAGDTVQKEKFEKITITVKKTDNYVPFEEAMKVKVSPKDSTAYYLLKILLNFREKHKRDPLPHERSQNILNDEAKAVIEEYNLENKIDNLVNGDVYAQISPVCAILGGVMGQEIIKTVSQKEQPHNNLFLFDPETMGGQVFRLK